MTTAQQLAPAGKWDGFYDLILLPTVIILWVVVLAMPRRQS